jgi:Tol biopolymer transport system component
MNSVRFWTALTALLMASLSFAGKGNGGGGKPGGGDPPPAADPAILCTSDSAFVVMNEDGSNVTTILAGVGSLASARWSPDGTRIVFVGDAPTRGIHIMNADGSGLTRLVDTVSLTTPDLGVAPSGAEWILFADSEPGDAPQFLFAIRPDGTGLTQLTSDPDVSHGTPVWSPDGTRFAAGQWDPYGVPSIVVFWIAEDAGSVQIAAAENVTNIAGSPLAGATRMDSYAWANTQDKLAVDFADDLWIIDLDSPAAAVNVSNDGAAFQERHPAWSPDDSRIAVRNTYGKRNERGLVVMDADGSSRTLILPNSGNYPDWK